MSAVNGLLSALKVDIESIVDIGFSNGKNIFYGKECQTAIMQAILKEIESNLNSIIPFR